MISVIHVETNPQNALAGSFSRSFTYGSELGQFSEIRNEIYAMGGYWEMRFRFRDTDIRMEEFYLKGLNRAVRAVGERGTTDFEGFVNAIRMNAAGSIFFKSLDRVANKIFSRYKDSSGTFKRSTPVQDIISQNKYGILDLPLNNGQLPSDSLAIGVTSRILTKRKRAISNPEQLSVSGEPGAENSIEVICHGMIRKFNRRVYNQTALTGNQSADLFIADILAATGSGIVKKQTLRPNNLGVSREQDSDRTALSIMVDIAMLGDPYYEPWVVYMDEGYEIFYEPAAPARDLNL